MVGAFVSRIDQWIVAGPCLITIIVIIVFVTMMVIIDRQQEVVMDKLGHLSALLPRRRVREAEVDA